jgi:hypothetical protein
MEEGKIKGDRYLKWMPYEEEQPLGIFLVGGEKINLGDFQNIIIPFVNGCRCVHCKKIFIDLI